MIAAWLAGLLRTRPLSLVGTAAGIAVTVALIATLAAFVQTSGSAMTRSATAHVPVDWQIELVPGADPAVVLQAVKDAAAVSTMATVAYASVDGFQAESGGTVQVTGAGKVLGVDPSYFSAFPGNLRSLAGDVSGVLAAQQTAANLHVGIGDSVIIHRPAVGDVQVKIDGVVDIPNADSLFQAIGVPPGAAPQAPPDNVLIVPLPLWHQLFDGQAAARPDSTRQQIHARLDHRVLPTDPQSAFIKVGGEGRNLELRVAGSAVVANDLASVLDTVREDALYASVLFLFLGTPGIAVAVLLTLAVANSGSGRRQRDQALVRLRGGTMVHLMQLAGAEALVVAAAGSVVGVIVAEGVSRLVLKTAVVTLDDVRWLAGAVFAGIALSLAAILLPAWRNARALTIVAARRPVGKPTRSLWQAAYLDIVLLVLGGVIYWRTAASGYQIVLASEGVAAIAVDYSAFLAPLLLWIGLGLLTVRLVLLGLVRGKSILALALRPIAAGLAPVVATFLERQRLRLTLGIALVGLAIAFATSTAIFNTTYEAQSRVDAELTNGSDVTVTGTSSAPAGQVLSALKALPGVTAAIPMQHRFAYVGSDLQDLYGIDPSTIGQAATMSNAYFGNGDAQTSLATLKGTRDGVLVSEETVSDFQLNLGDTVNLRLQSAKDHQYHAVPFRFVGIVREFPTAPHDSFLVANADYVARMTGSDSAEVVLLRVAGDLGAAGRGAAAIVNTMPGVKVTDIGEARQLISSSLTAVDLGNLTRIELTYALLLVASAAGLILALGVIERRRSFAILTLLGAKPLQLRAFIASEGLIVLLAGVAVGLSTGGLIAAMLVKLLTGVFDPPPEGLSFPWVYLVVMIAVASGAMLGAIWSSARYVNRSTSRDLREAG